MSTKPHIATKTDAERLATETRRRAADAKKLLAEQEQVHELTLRMKRTERALLSILSSKALTDAQREELVGCLAGTRTSAIETRYASYSPSELQLIEHYRGLNQGDKTNLTRWAKALGEIERLKAKKGGA